MEAREIFGLDFKADVVVLIGEVHQSVHLCRDAVSDRQFVEDRRPVDGVMAAIEAEWNAIVEWWKQRSKT